LMPTPGLFSVPAVVVRMCATAPAHPESARRRPLQSRAVVSAAAQFCQIAPRERLCPKSFSPLKLRTPLRAGGSFYGLKVSVEAAPMGLKLIAAVLLGVAVRWRR